MKTLSLLLYLVLSVVLLYGAVCPIWAGSPMRNEIVYTQEIDGHLQLFKVDLGSRVVTQLTHIGVAYQANASADWFDPVTLDVLLQPQLLPIEWGKIKKR